ncbi:MAG: pseudouridine synthase [Alphaproteobacteria bacterium]|nr:MAG: pseudouridine synthase [Alphaproteobacteria bacterium]
MAEKKPSAENDKPERIAKVLARAGLCSRRDAERWIAAGRVAVNGRVLDSPAVTVGPRDRVSVDGKPLPARQPTRLWRFHKPRGLLTTARDPEGRPTVFERLPPELPRVVSVGRLDLNSEGLLLLTNDGELARRLELPSTGWTRRYRVRVFGQVDEARLASLAKGVTVDGVKYGAIRATLDRQQGDNAWLSMSLAEGKNREVRRVCEHFGWRVSRLIRVSYGPFQLGALEPESVEEVPTRVLKDQLGLARGDETGKARRKAPATKPPHGHRTAAKSDPGTRTGKAKPDRRRKAT